jgi:hypothetical protein
MVAAQNADPAWLPWPKNRHLDDVFCFKYRRMVGNDNTVGFALHLIDIPPSRDGNSHAHASVETHERFDGTLCIFVGGVWLAKKVLANCKTLYRVAVHSEATDLPPVAVISKPKAFRPPRSTAHQPAAAHPRRRSVVLSR